ncbi:MAG: hypothetical protein WKF84_15730 [Pyrinomonadaceae bacterium]
MIFQEGAAAVPVLLDALRKADDSAALLLTGQAFERQNDATQALTAYRRITFTPRPRLKPRKPRRRSPHAWGRASRRPLRMKPWPAPAAYCKLSSTTTRRALTRRALRFPRAGHARKQAALWRFTRRLKARDRCDQRVDLRVGFDS